MKTIYILLLYFFAFLVETTVFSRLSIFGAKPDLVLVVLIFLAVKKGRFTGELYGFVGGVLEDIISSTLLGLQAMVKTLVGYIVGFFKNKLMEESFVLIFLFVFIVSLFHSFLVTIGLFLFTDYSFPLGNIFNSIISGLYTALLAPPVFAFLNKTGVGE